METKGSCLGRVPYNSVIGFILILVGGGVLCGTLYHAISKLDLFFQYHFFPVYSLPYLRIAAVVNGAGVVLLAFIVVIFSALVTNATRGRIYRGDRFIMGGRFSAALFLCITYVAIIIWLLFLAFLVVPTFCWIMFNSICATELADVWHGPGARRPGPDGRVAPTLDELRERNELDNSYVSRLSFYYPSNGGANSASGGALGGLGPVDMGRGDPGAIISQDDLIYSRGSPYAGRSMGRLYLRYVFNLTHYGVYVKPWMYDRSLNYREAITSTEGFAIFCDEVSIVGPLFACSLGGAIFVLFGLTLFVGSLSAFYTRLKLTKELTDFKQSFALRSPKAHDHAAYF